jgi:hypothetical protein
MLILDVNVGAFFNQHIEGVNFSILSANVHCGVLSAHGLGLIWVSTSSEQGMNHVAVLSHIWVASIGQRIEGPETWVALIDVGTQFDEFDGDLRHIKPYGSVKS